MSAFVNAIWKDFPAIRLRTIKNSTFEEVYAAHVSGSGSNLVVSYFWTPITFCRSHCTAVRELLNAAPPQPKNKNKKKLF